MYVWAGGELSTGCQALTGGVAVNGQAFTGGVAVNGQTVTGGVAVNGAMVRARGWLLGWRRDRRSSWGEEAREKDKRGRGGTGTDVVARTCL